MSLVLQQQVKTRSGGYLRARVLHGLGQPAGDPYNLDETGENVLSDTGAGRTPEQRGPVAGFAMASETSPVLVRLFRRRSQLKPSTVDDVLFLYINLKHHAKQRMA